MAVKDFKVIIVGGGPVGLTAAHALERAGIDFVLLERQPEIAMNAGSNLVLSALGLQAMTQLGLAQALSDISTPIITQERLDHAGQDLGTMVFFQEMKKILGVSPRATSRYGLTSTLFNKLSKDSQARCLPGKQLCGIRSTPTGVVASCKDGSSYSGNIIIGADGAHSATRDFMQNLNETNNAQTRKMPFLTTYRCLWIRFHTPQGLPLGTSCETHGYGASTQLFAGEESAVMALYERLENPTRERIRHTPADREAIVRRWGHLPLIPNSMVTLRDLYETRMDAGLVSLEEGVVKDWSCGGRVVLVGDAAHKYTPSTGAGCNTGILDVAALTGELVKVIRTARAATGALPESAALHAAFESYEAIRRPFVEVECRVSGERTALSTWLDEQSEYQDRHVVNGLEFQQAIIGKIADALTKAPAFERASPEQPGVDIETPSMATAVPLRVAVH